ncbi:unnamed protein product, partial [Ectocarpus fasciculatus]
MFFFFRVAGAVAWSIVIGFPRLHSWGRNYLHLCAIFF